VAVGSLAWQGHFGDALATLTGGVQYDLAASTDGGSGVRWRFNDTGSSGDFIWGSTDFTGGFPDPWTSTTSNVTKLVSIRCGVDAEGGTHYTEDISHDGSWHTMTTATLSRAADYKRKVSHS